MADADAIIIGAGLAGLVAATELADAGKSVIVLEQEPRQNLGAQAFWSLGGLFLVDTPEQRRMGIRDSFELAWRDWQGSAAFDRDEDAWPRRWAEAYVAWAAGGKRDWLRAMGHRIFPVVGWAERGDGRATGHGNSVPRFHITWGTGPGVVAPFARRLLEAAERGRIRLCFRHRVDGLIRADGAVTGAHGAILADDDAPRGVSSNRQIIGDFRFSAGAVIVASGGIGGDLDLVRAAWPARLGAAPRRMVAGVPAHVDGRMLGLSEAVGARVINRDRMWHYVEGVRNWDPVWPNHGIRILPGPSSLWLDAHGQRLPPPLFPGYDTLGTLAHLRRSGADYSWLILTQSIIKKEFALSGSEQNPDLTGQNWRLVAQRAFGKAATGPVEAFKAKGADFIVADRIDDLLARMAQLAGDGLLDVARAMAEVTARDQQLDNAFSKDSQLMGVLNGRRYRGDRLVRTARPHRLLDPRHGPLIAVRLNILTRKTLGGLATNLDSAALDAGGAVIPALYAVGEVAGFGGGGMHGYRALEGTFLGGCLFSGRQAGQAAARAT